MKKILFITPQICFPPTDGGKQAQYYPIMAIGKRVETYSIMVNIDQTPQLKYLHEDSYVAMKDRMKDLQILERYNPNFTDGNGYERFNQAMNWLCNEKPRCAQIFSSPEKRAWVMKYIHDHEITVVCIEFPYMSELIDIGQLQRSDVKVVCIAHNVESILLKEVNSQYSYGLKKILNVDVKRLARYEKKILGQVDLVLAISKLDEEYIHNQLEVPHVAYLPVLIPDVGERWSANVQADYMVFNGSMSFFPNYHGIKWLLEGVHDQLAVSLSKFKIKITGKIPAHIREEFKKYKSVEFTGMLSKTELAAVLQKSKFAIIPIVKGSGTKMKILELMAYGIPIITTSQGVQGFNSEDQPLLVADSPQDFYNKILFLAKDDNACIHYGGKARTFFENNFLDSRNVDKWLSQL